MKVIKEKNGDITVVDDGNSLVFGFNQFTKSNYYDVLKDQFECIDCIHIGNYYYLEGGCEYEFRVEWVLLGSNVAVYIKMFDDCWKFMDQINPVFDMLKSFDGKVPTPNEFASKLLEMGLCDLSRSADKPQHNEP